MITKIQITNLYGKCILTFEFPVMQKTLFRAYRLKYFPFFRSKTYELSRRFNFLPFHS